MSSTQPEQSRTATSDVNFAAYLCYFGTKINNTLVTSEGGRARVWFDFDCEVQAFEKMKQDFFSQSESSKVIAQKLFQERERVYSMMIQMRNNFR